MTSAFFIDVARHHYSRTIGLGLLFVALLCAEIVRAASGGTTGATVLNFPVGARAIAMGEAYTAPADDVSSLYWNPAGLGLLNQSQASFMNHQFVEGISFSNVSVGTPLENGGIGGSLSYLSYGKIDGYDVNDRPTGNISAYSAVATVGGALYSGQSWSFGGNLKGIQSSLADVKANTWAADAGAIYAHPTMVLDGTLRLAATMRNVGMGIKYIDQKDSLPTEFRFGAALVQTLNRKLTVATDFGKMKGAPFSTYLGAEYKLLSPLALRMGWAGTEQEGQGMRLGIGLRVRDFALDYALSGFGELGYTNLLEASMRFGVIRPTLTPEEREILRRAKLAMLKERYSESTLLFNTLVELEPNYKPVKKYLKASMALFEKQEKERGDIGTPVKQANLRRTLDLDDAEELEGMMQLLENKGTTPLQNHPDRDTIAAPRAPTGDDALPLKMQREGAPKQ